MSVHVRYPCIVLSVQGMMERDVDLPGYAIGGLAGHLLLGSDADYSTVMLLLLQQHARKGLAPPPAWKLLVE